MTAQFFLKKKIREIKYSHQRVIFKSCRENANSHPKKELTSTALVLSSIGTESFVFVSEMSAEAFLALKKAWKKTNLGKKNKETLVNNLLFIKQRTSQRSNKSYLATSMMRSSCFFTWWLSMMEASRETIHFLRRNTDSSFLRKDNQQVAFIHFPCLFCPVQHTFSARSSKNNSRCTH